MRVAQIMEPLNNWLTPEMTILQAIQVMKRTRRGHGLPVNGIPVLDNDMKLVGILSTKDILRFLIPSYMYLDALDGEDQSWESMRFERTEKANSVNVQAIMSEDVRSISLTASVMRCADMMLVEQIRRLPVVGTEGKVLGIVYIRDVYNAITEILCDTSAITMAPA